jgi:arabinogalactan oligomer/maltooligosaccharide transport system permease protein
MPNSSAPVTPVTAPADAKKTRMRKHRRGSLEAYAWLSPALVSISILTCIPIAYTIFVAFTNMNLYHFQKYSFPVFTNFIQLFKGPFAESFLPVFFWTIIFATVTSVLNYSLGLFLALLLNNKHLKESAIYRGILIIPWALPGTIAVLALGGIFNESFGPINGVLKLLGLGAIKWLNHPNWVKVTIMLGNLWLGYPFFMASCLGGLQSIPEELYEAADIDGATGWQKFWRITFPNLLNFSIPLVISSFAYNFNNFGIVYLLTGGGPPRPNTSFVGFSDTISTFGYQLVGKFFRYEMAGAMSIVLFLIVGTITLIQMRMTHAFEEAE